MMKLVTLHQNQGNFNMTNHLFNGKTYKGIALATALSFASPVFADMVSTDQLAGQVQTESKRAELNALMARSDVKAQMIKLGVNMDDAQGRVARMSDAELASVYSKLDALPAGGDGLGIVLTVILIFILLELAGVTDIFPKI